MQELVKFITTSLVDDPSQVEITQDRRGSQVTVNLQVAKEDMGRIIGKGGRVANAIRILLRVAAAQDGKRATLEIIEPE